MPAVCLRATSPRKSNGDLKVFVVELGSTLFKGGFGPDLFITVGRWCSSVDNCILRLTGPYLLGEKRVIRF